jgi:hypothetical protein
VDRDAFVASLAPVIRAYAKSRFRKPKDVARLLNNRGKRTAIGERWTPRLTHFLLGFIFSPAPPNNAPSQTAGGEIRGNIVAHRPLHSQAATPCETGSTTSTPQPLAGSEVQGSLQYLDRDKVAERLAALGRVVRRGKPRLK